MSVFVVMGVAVTELGGGGDSGTGEAGSVALRLAPTQASNPPSRSLPSHHLHLYPTLPYPSLPYPSQHGTPYTRAHKQVQCLKKVTALGDRHVKNLLITLRQDKHAVTPESANNAFAAVLTVCYVIAEILPKRKTLTDDLLKSITVKARTCGQPIETQQQHQYESYRSVS